MMGSITIVGLGPANIQYLTLEAWETIRTADTLLLRTAIHPAADDLLARGIAFASYDDLYESAGNFETVYRQIALDVVGRAESVGKVVFAVPGSPLVAEKAVAFIRELAAAKQIIVDILPGMSFLELMFVRLGVDPQQGLTVVDAGDIHQLPPDLDTALLVTQVYNTHVASELKLTLMERYPDEYPVTLAVHIGLSDETVQTMPLYELDRQPSIDHLTSLYVPAREKRQKEFSLDPVIDVMSKLRSPGGCVWDMEQTHASLRRYIVEEVYEVLEAIDMRDAGLLCEELGDLLLQIIFHARMAEETGEFSMQDVIDRVVEKLIRRHPHVFGEVNVRDAAEVIVNWDAIKRNEKGSQRQSVLDGVPKGLPALMRGEKLQVKAAKVGFDWQTIEPVWEKVAEELAELKEATDSGDADRIESELGDVIFAVVNLARFLHVEAEVALNRTNNRFIKRFKHVESLVKQRELEWTKLDLAALDRLWEEAKAATAQKRL